MHDLVVDLMAVAVCGALGGFVNVFIGDSGLHLPTVEEGVFRPGYIGVVLVGMVAAVGAWLATQVYVQPLEYVGRGCRSTSLPRRFLPITQ